MLYFVLTLKNQLVLKLRVSQLIQNFPVLKDEEVTILPCCVQHKVSLCQFTGNELCVQ